LSWETAISASKRLPPIGIYGGTFDPIHYGHLRLAEELADFLSLAQVRFIPAAQPPLRGGPQASPRQRLAMVELAIQGNPRFIVDARELQRVGPSYTVDTLRELRQELGEAQPLFLFMGADAFLKLGAWHEWRQLFTLAHLVVAHRPGYDPAAWVQRLDAGVLAEFNARQGATPQAAAILGAGCILTFPMTALEISATRIRSLIQAGHSARYLLPDAVVDYIGIEQLYS
jgi:nicotinate-nucleotide adenylyltransferase